MALILYIGLAVSDSCRNTYSHVNIVQRISLHFKVYSWEISLTNIVKKNFIILLVEVGPIIGIYFVDPDSGLIRLNNMAKTRRRADYRRSKFPTLKMKNCLGP